jgi:hypothetical protein
LEQERELAEQRKEKGIDWYQCGIWI